MPVAPAFAGVADEDILSAGVAGLGFESLTALRRLHAAGSSVAFDEVEVGLVNEQVAWVRAEIEREKREHIVTQLVGLGLVVVGPPRRTVGQVVRGRPAGGRVVELAEDWRDRVLAGMSDPQLQRLYRGQVRA